jgi:hypothetical protein
MAVYFETPLMLGGLENPYFLIALATFPLSVGVRLLRHRRILIGVAIMTAGSILGAYGIWLFSRQGPKELALPLYSSLAIAAVIALLMTRVLYT